MKKILLVVLMLALGIGGVLWWKKSRGEAVPKPEEKPAAEESRVKRDEQGRVVVHMSDETQGTIGLLVAKPKPATVVPEITGYGRVLDPAPLAGLLSELVSARAAIVTSSNELARLKTLVGNGNASERALQTAEAAALKDQLAVQSAVDRLALAWGDGLLSRPDFFALVRDLTVRQAALVRIELPVGEKYSSPPEAARITSLAGSSASAEFLGAAANVDPQTLGHGFIFVIRTNAAEFPAGEAVTGYLRPAGEPLAGVLIPREAIVRTEGAPWIYLLNSGGAAFTRTPISLSRAIEGGWFVNQGVTTNDNVVVTGAQTLLSEELKGSLKPD
jgi:hypothetical protein